MIASSGRILAIGKSLTRKKVAELDAQWRPNGIALKRQKGCADDGYQSILAALDGWANR